MGAELTVSVTMINFDGDEQGNDTCKQGLKVRLKQAAAYNEQGPSLTSFHSL